MRRLLTVFLVVLMIDWVFFSGAYVALPITGTVSAGATFAAELVLKGTG